MTRSGRRFHFKTKKVTIFTFAVMLSVAVILTVCGIAFKQAAWRMLPLYVSLFISLLQSRVNRFAPLIAGANSLLYAAVYFSYSLYTSAVYALAVSAPLQIITFIRWQKHRAGSSTVLRSLTNVQRLSVAAGFISAWILLFFMTRGSGSKYFLLDNTVTLLGILSTVLMMLSFVEYTYSMVIGCVCSLTLYITMLPLNPEQLTYAVYMAYSLFCCVLALITAMRTFNARKKQSILSRE